MIMEASPDISKAVEWSKYISAEPEEAAEIKSMYQEARDFLEFYDWCSEIINSFVGIFYPGGVAVFLFEISPSRPDIDKWIWVVVGDIPPAYLTTDECTNPAEALDGYVGAMQEWVDAAQNGTSVADLIPVNAPATKANATALKTRLDFLEKNILSEYKGDLNA